MSQDHGASPSATGPAPSGLSPCGSQAEPLVPSAIAEQILRMGRVEWGATDKFTDEGHLRHLARSLRATRVFFDLDDEPVAMDGLYLAGTETVLCHTGTSPHSGPNAQALAGAWNWLHDLCASAIEARSDATGTGAAEGESAAQSEAEGDAHA